ncbi:MAG: GNAT family N-acetyltransferase [Candidatus Thermoplasmatota archaeon]|nr:GNAT family N-acetyltransferase [Candidatus Thermoplasmatota archaeon]
MPMDDVEFIHTHEWPAEEIVELYRAGGWWKEEYRKEGISRLLSGSFDLVIAYHRLEKRAVGMGRMISDGVSDGYIQDLVVLPHLRGRGIGGRMVKELAGYARKRGLVWIGLIAEEGSTDFYRELGFKVFNGTPMIYDPEGRG